jgi:hypothetical protein
MNDYTKGILTGASLILCFFMFVSANQQGKDVILGKVLAEQIVVKGYDGDVFIRGGTVTTFTKDAKLTTTLGTGEDGEGILYLYDKDINAAVSLMSGQFGGILNTFNADGKQTVYLGTSEDGSGMLKTNNADGKKIAFFGTGGVGVGVLETFKADGKRTVYLGTGESGNGQLRTFNKHEVLTGFFGANKDNDGMAVLLDRYGDEGWSASGKK